MFTKFVRKVLVKVILPEMGLERLGNLEKWKRKSVP